MKLWVTRCRENMSWQPCVKSLFRSNKSFAPLTVSSRAAKSPFDTQNMWTMQLFTWHSTVTWARRRQLLLDSDCAWPQTDDSCSVAQRLCTVRAVLLWSSVLLLLLLLLPPPQNHDIVWRFTWFHRTFAAHTLFVGQQLILFSHDFIMIFNFGGGAGSR